MKHSRGTTGSRNNPGLLIISEGAGVVSKLYLLEDAGWVAGVPSFGAYSGVCSFPVQHSETERVLTPPPGVRLRHRLGR